MGDERIVSSCCDDEIYPSEYIMWYGQYMTCFRCKKCHKVCRRKIIRRERDG